ncbi:hypothetical protein FRC10_003812 [Ceratobasidium sp. 414]|nr:hypothetical protein FRC10_003812 [Ceratobasidium sp. 414]
MDGVGRVLPDKRNTAVQFRKIDDREDREIIHSDFCADPDLEGLLTWPLESLLFERRIRQTTDHQASRRSVELYDLAIPLSNQVALSVANLDELRQKLNDYERSFTLPEATNEANDWHPAALRVFRQAGLFAHNVDPAHIIYPAEFVSRDQPGHSAWSATALRDFFLRKPFCADGSSILNGGSSGVAVGFYAILQYTINVLRVAPKDKEEEEIMIDSDMHVYGRAELRTLAQCVSILLQDLEVSKDKLAATTGGPRATLSPLPCDLEARFGSWHPTRCVERQGEGGEEILPMTKVLRPDQNVFALFAEEGVDSSDAGEESAEDEPMSISESEADTQRTSATGSIETLRGDINGDYQESLVADQVDGAAIERRSGEPAADLTTRHGTRDTIDVEVQPDPKAASPAHRPANRAASTAVTPPAAIPANSASSVRNFGAAARLLSFANGVSQRGGAIPDLHFAGSHLTYGTHGMPEPLQTPTGGGVVSMNSLQSIPVTSSRGSRGVKRVRGKGGIDSGAAGQAKRAK